MKHPKWSVLAAAALLIASACQECAAQDLHVIGWETPMLGSMRALYAGMRTEFAGCLYGSINHDSADIRLFIPASIDPRTASDSEVLMQSCPILHGDRLIGIVHSHMRAASVCAPSGFPDGAASKPLIADSLIKDRAVLRDWMRFGVLFSAIMCAHGDSIVEFSIDKDGVMTGFGGYRLPSLDSLYQKP